MMRLVLACLLLNATAAAQTPEASGDTATQQTGAIAGTVTEGDTGLPIPFANVFVTEIQRGAATDSLGRFEITGIPVGTYRVSVLFAGYQPVVREVRVAEGVTHILAVELRPGVSCLGLICDCFNHLVLRDAYTYRSILAERFDPDPCACDCSEGTIPLQSLPTAR